LKLLLDTHALLWWWTDDPKLSGTSRQAIADTENQVLVSAASAWEIATKYRLGKLPHAAQALDRFNELVVADGFEHLPIDYMHSLKAGAYSNAHRDPFDRILAAQANLEKAVLVTLDPVFAEFECQVLW
jgi:PIN domain nuclease of toxin-antitoxin system